MVQRSPPGHLGNNKYCVASAGRGTRGPSGCGMRGVWAQPPHPAGQAWAACLAHSVRRMMWMPESVNTGPLISPARSAKEASSNGFCI